MAAVRANEFYEETSRRRFNATYDVSTSLLLNDVKRRLHAATILSLYGSFVHSMPSREWRDRILRPKRTARNVTRILVLEKLNLADRRQVLP